MDFNSSSDSSSNDTGFVLKRKKNTNDYQKNLDDDEDKTKNFVFKKFGHFKFLNQTGENVIEERVVKINQEKDKKKGGSKKNILPQRESQIEIGFTDESEDIYEEGDEDFDYYYGTRGQTSKKTDEGYDDSKDPKKTKNFFELEKIKNKEKLAITEISNIDQDFKEFVESESSKITQKGKNRNDVQNEQNMDIVEDNDKDMDIEKKKEELIQNGIKYNYNFDRRDKNSVNQFFINIKNFVMKEIPFMGYDFRLYIKDLRRCISIIRENTEFFYKIEKWKEIVEFCEEILNNLCETIFTKITDSIATLKSKTVRDKIQNLDKISYFYCYSELQYITRYDYYSSFDSKDAQKITKIITTKLSIDLEGYSDIEIIKPYLKNVWRFCMIMNRGCIYGIYSEDMDFLFEYMKKVFINYICEDVDYDFSERSEIDKHYDLTEFYYEENGLYVMSNVFIQFAESFYYHMTKKKILYYNSIQYKDLYTPDMDTMINYLMTLKDTICEKDQIAGLDSISTKVLATWLVSEYEREGYATTINNSMSNIPDVDILSQFRLYDANIYVENFKKEAGLVEIFKRDYFGDSKIFISKGNKGYERQEKSKDKKSEEEYIKKRNMEFYKSYFFSRYLDSELFDPVLENMTIQIFNIYFEANFKFSVKEMITNYDNIWMPLETNSFYNSYYCQIVETSCGYSIWDVNLKRFLAYKSFLVCFIIFLSTIVSGYKNNSDKIKTNSIDNIIDSSKSDLKYYYNYILKK